MPYVPREAVKPKASPMPLKFAPTLSSESQDARIAGSRAGEEPGERRTDEDRDGRADDAKPEAGRNRALIASPLQRLRPDPQSPGAGVITQALHDDHHGRHDEQRQRQQNER